MIGFEITSQSESEKPVYIDGCKNITNHETTTNTSLMYEKGAKEK
jgi:hypothetical protein